MHYDPETPGNNGPIKDRGTHGTVFLPNCHQNGSIACESHPLGLDRVNESERKPGDIFLGPVEVGAV